MQSLEKELDATIQPRKAANMYHWYGCGSGMKGVLPSCVAHIVAMAPGSMQDLDSFSDFKLSL